MCGRTLHTTIGWSLLIQTVDEQLHNRMLLTIQAPYAERRVIVCGKTTLEISQFVALDDDDDEVAAREDLLADLELGD